MDTELWKDETAHCANCAALSAWCVILERPAADRAKEFSLSHAPATSCAQSGAGICLYTGKMCVLQSGIGEARVSREWRNGSNSSYNCYSSHKL